MIDWRNYAMNCQAPRLAMARGFVPNTEVVIPIIGVLVLYELATEHKKSKETLGPDASPLCRLRSRKSKRERFAQTGVRAEKSLRSKVRYAQEVVGI